MYSSILYSFCAHCLTSAFHSFSFIQPCRSLCVAVRDSCAPVLACQGHPWPEALNCDRFPAEEDMCLSPHAKFSHFAKGKGQITNIKMLFYSVLCHPISRVDYHVVACNYCTGPAVLLNSVYFLSQTCPNLLARTALLWKRLRQ